MKYLKYFEKDSDYQSYIIGDKILPNVSYTVDTDIVYYNPYIVPPNSFTGVVNAADTTTSYRLFSGGTVGMNNIKVMKINDVEVTPVSATTFSTTGENTCYVEVIEPVTTMSNMFYRCSGLTSLDLSNWDTSKVTSMYNMFASSSGLTSVGDLSKWDTSKVIDMGSMFKGCRGLTSLDLSKWDTSKVTNMNQMFISCTSLTSIGDLSKWDTSKVYNMNGMFSACSGLTTLDLSKWDTSNVIDMGNMFSGCWSLTTVGDLSNWDTSNVTYMRQMFSYCSGLTSLDLTNWDTSNVTNMGSIFGYCTKLTEVRMGGNPSSLTNVTDMFKDITATGTFYYNSVYDYSIIITELPSTWTAIPCTLVDGVLVPNE